MTNLSFVYERGTHQIHSDSQGGACLERTLLKLRIHIHVHPTPIYIMPAATQTGQFCLVISL